MHAPTILIASYLEHEHLDRVRRTVPAARVLYDEGLVAPPRFPSDHVGRRDFRRPPEDEARFLAWLGEAEVLYGFDRRLLPSLATHARRLRWIQATYSGIGPALRQANLRGRDVVVTNAAGVHAIPLAEHVLLSMLYFVKDVPGRLRDQRAHRWEPGAVEELHGRTIGILGFGAIGAEVARLARALGMTVLGMKRSRVDDPASLGLDAAFTPDGLHDLLPRCDVLVSILPQSDETEGLLGAVELGLLPRGAVFVNIGRGATVDEAALLDALRSNHLRGAALDVTATEPLPDDHPLWDEPNVFITPHTAATSVREDERLMDLFCDNLLRFTGGRPLRNVFTG